VPEPSLPRGTVTFLFSDIEGSSELVRRMGDDVFAAVRADHRRLLREAFAAQGGREIDTAGDGFFVAFDSARSAGAAAVSAQLALAEFAWPAGAEVKVRIGLHTAEPHLGEDGYVGTGVHRAQRICDAGHGGQILLSNATAGIIEDADLPNAELIDLGEHVLKGLPRRQRLFQLTVLTLPSEFGPPRSPQTDPPVPGVGTFLHSDLAKWWHVVRSLGDEASAVVLADYHQTVSAVVEGSNGIVLELVGDHGYAVFRVASDGVRAAAGLRDALRDYAWPPGCDVAVSIVLHSGRWSGNPKRPDAATVFFRLTQLGKVVEPDQVLLSQTTASLLEGDPRVPGLRSLGERTIEDLGEAMRLYELGDSR
jgi:class 3 adenylate cyclase